MTRRDDAGPKPRARRNPWPWGVGGVGACAAAAVAVLMIVSGRGYTPGPAPMPPKDFSIAASHVPDPVAGPPPRIGAPPQPRTSTRPTGTLAPAPRQQAPAGPLADDTLVIPALGVNAPVGASGIVDRALVLPDDVRRTTEWSGSAPITSSRGTILVAGHVNNIDQGDGALWALHLIQPGDAVYLVKDNTVTRWKVTAITAVVKSALPQALFVGDQGPRLLKLVTCGGKLEHTSTGLGYYQDNVIATAVPF